MTEGKPQQLTAEQLTEEVGKVLTCWPLYRPFSYKGKDATGKDVHYSLLGSGERFAVLPERLGLHCSDCDQLTQWQTGGREVYIGRGGFHEQKYTCRNCGERSITYFLLWLGGVEGGSLFKVGQCPPLTHEPPKEVAKALDQQDKDYYTKALDCRNFNYGLGAITYLRRIVEKRMNDLLDLLAEVAAQEGTFPDALARIQEAKSSQRADDRLEIANVLLPERLKGGGHNPLSYIYDVTSDAIHRKSEEECIDVFDKARTAFEYLFVQLRHEKTTREEYLASLKTLEEKSKQIRSRREAGKTEEGNSSGGETAS